MAVASISTVRPPLDGATRTGSVVKSAATGGVLGAAVGVGLSFTSLPFIGALAAPIAAAIGGAAGLVLGGIIGLLRGRSGSHDAAAGSAVGGQTAPPPPGTSSNGLPPALPR